MGIKMTQKIKLETIFARSVVGFFYGIWISFALTLITNNNPVPLDMTSVTSLSMGWSSIAILSFCLGGIGSVAFVLALPLAGDGVAFLALPLSCAVIVTLIAIAKYQNITLKILIDKHISWLFSLINKLIYVLLKYRSFSKKSNILKVKQKSWDICLIVLLTQGLAEVFPKEWDEWQPEIECMMAFRQRQQSKGINHRLISLITFYHFSLFVWHIGIDKVFILATRRSTR